MRIGLILVVTTVLAGNEAAADAPFATATFAKVDPKTSKTLPITAALINDDVCVLLRDVSTEDGDHSLRLTIYDGAGREAYSSVRTITAKDKKWGRTVCYSFNAEHDAPGTWWYVAELDDQPLVSKELLVARAPSRESANTSCMDSSRK